MSDLYTVDLGWTDEQLDLIFAAWNRWLWLGANTNDWYFARKLEELGLYIPDYAVLENGVITIDLDCLFDHAVNILIHIADVKYLDEWRV